MHKELFNIYPKNEIWICKLDKIRQSKIYMHTHAHTHTHTHCTYTHTCIHTCTHTHACMHAHTHTHTHAHTHAHTHTCGREGRSLLMSVAQWYCSILTPLCRTCCGQPLSSSRRSWLLALTMSASLWVRSSCIPDTGQPQNNAKHSRA